jgi:hypothetical protein
LRSLSHSHSDRARRTAARLILILVLAQHPAGFQIDQMHTGAGDARERLIGVTIAGHLIGGPSLHVLAGVEATIDKRPGHRTKIAQAKREKPQPDGAGAKSGQVDFVRHPKGNGLTPPIQSECSAGVNQRAAGDFHPMLENSRKPCGKRVERRWIGQEIRHRVEWHEDQQSIDPIPNGWGHFLHPANINRFARAVNTDWNRAKLSKRNSEASAGPPLRRWPPLSAVVINRDVHAAILCHYTNGC